jgi:hypothetical protein
MFIRKEKFNGQIIKEQYKDDKSNFWLISFDKSSNKFVLYKNEKQVAMGSVPELNKLMYK